MAILTTIIVLHNGSRSEEDITIKRMVNDCMWYMTRGRRFFSFYIEIIFLVQLN